MAALHAMQIAHGGIHRRNILVQKYRRAKHRVWLVHLSNAKMRDSDEDMENDLNR